MYCTTLHLHKRTVYRSLCLLLLVALLFQWAIPLPAESRAVWDEALVPWPSKRCPLRYRRYQQACLVFLAQRTKVLLCRLGLVAALLLWSGWPQRQPWSWALLGVPMVDAWLSLLPLWWSGVAKRRSYLCLVRGMHRLYLIVVILLFSQGLTSRGGRAASLGLVGGWVKPALVVRPGVADDGQARGWIADDSTWNLDLAGDQFNFSYKPRDEFEERVLLVLFRQFRTPQSTPKRPFLRQEWLAAWFGTHQELISRWQRYVREGGLQKLSGEYEGWVLTETMRDAILGIWGSNFWLSAPEVRERLLAEGHIANLTDISETSIHQAAKDSGFAGVRRQLRKMFQFTAAGPQWRDEVLINRLFEPACRQTGSTKR